jgi:WD40 repeat protein
MSRRLHFVRLTLGCAVAVFCSLIGFLLWFFWNPFERIREPEALATIGTKGGSPYRFHAAVRDELVFLQNSTLEVYRIGPTLAKLRSVPVAIEGLTEFDHVSAFHNSPRAVVFADEARLSIVNTETGKVEQTIVLPDTVGDVIVSPDERWLALNLHDTQVLSRDPVTGKPAGMIRGWGPLAVVNVNSGEVVKLIDPQAPKAIPGAMAFVGANSLFVNCSPPESIQFWDLLARQCKWTAPADEGLYPGSAAGGDSRVLAGHHNSCKLWDAENGSVIWSRPAARTATAVAFNRKTGDYLAGYSRHNFTLRAGLGGTIRIWNASGERLLTFAAHRDSDWPRINWMALSMSGKYLVTADDRHMKVWDYAAVAGRGEQ